jgi:hypothetical protein
VLIEVGVHVAIKQDILEEVHQRDAHLVVRRLTLDLAQYLAQQQISIEDALKDVTCALRHRLAVNECEKDDQVVSVEIFKPVLVYNQRVSIHSCELQPDKGPYVSGADESLSRQRL